MSLDNNGTKSSSFCCFESKKSKEIFGTFVFRDIYPIGSTINEIMNDLNHSYNERGTQLVNFPIICTKINWKTTIPIKIDRNRGVSKIPIWIISVF